MANDILVSAEHLSHSFRLSSKAQIEALRDVSFTIRRGEIFGLVGESGSGKSTAARCVMNVIRPSSGRVVYDGIDTSNRHEVRSNRARLQKERQFVFQDSGSSLNQRMTVRRILEEPLNIHGLYRNREEREELLRRELGYVGIEPHYLDSRPPQLSGGQRQRVSIARALLMDPKLVVADEPVASLDVSIQAQIVNLFRHLQAEHGFTFLFIAHDLAMVEFLCDRVGVMVQGRMVELAETGELYRRPVHPYTQALLAAMPVPDPRIERERKIPVWDERSFTGREKWTEISEGHFVLLEGGDGR